jgi:hypothetical protein
MDQDFLDDEETLQQTPKRRYAVLAAWVVRANRPQDPQKQTSMERLSMPARCHFRKCDPSGQRVAQ